MNKKNVKKRLLSASVSSGDSPRRADPLEKEFKLAMTNPPFPPLLKGPACPVGRGVGGLLNGLRLFIVITILFAFSCDKNKPSIFKKSRALIDTYVTISVVTDSSDKAENAIEKAFLTIERFGGLINFYSDTSELSLINRSAGIKEVTVSPQTLDIIEKALHVSERSGGAFDPTIGPVIKLWDFHEKKKPSETEIKKMLPLVNYRDVVIDKEKSTVFLKKKGMLLDLGGIAKGYAADLAVNVLKLDGIQSGLVAIAGDIRAFGLKPDKKPWKIGIQNPRQKNVSDEIIAKLSLSNQAVSTSGDYQRYFFINGERYHHLIDPKTGYPVNKCRSVSIITDEGVYADSFSTAVFILDPERGIKLAQEEGVGAVIIDSKGKFHTTPGLKGNLEIEGNH